VEPAESAKWQMMQHCWAVGQWERMEGLGKQLLVTRPSDADLLNAVGVAVFQLGRREEAADYFRDAITSEPDHAPSHSMMAWYWARKRKFSPAEQCLQTAISIDPSNDTYWVELGQVMLMQGNHRGAKTCAAKALALNAENVSAIALESEADGMSDIVGRTAPAERRERVEAALALEPDNADLHEALGEVYHDQGRLREAEERSTSTGG
jgi:Flp pilus assembly protein TadD